MTRTFAVMTPEQRAECVGLWFDSPLGLSIYTGTDSAGDHLFVVPGASDLVWGGAMLRAVPRLDLPRAWNADGNPLKWGWEEDFTDFEGCVLSTGEYLPEVGPHEAVRRWIGEWEVTE